MRSPVIHLPVLLIVLNAIISSSTGKDGLPFPRNSWAAFRSKHPTLAGVGFALLPRSPTIEEETQQNRPSQWAKGLAQFGTDGPYQDRVYATRSERRESGWQHYFAENKAWGEAQGEWKEISTSQAWIDSQWVDASRVISTYDSCGNNLEEIHQEWDEFRWLNTWRSYHAYDIFGNILEDIVKTWEDSLWVNALRKTSSYDASGNLLEEIQQRWENSQWVGDRRETYYYDSAGNVLEHTRELWDGSQWVGIDQRFYTYDADGNLVEYLKQEWDGSAWIGRDRYIYTYDGFGNKLEYIRQYWNGSQWVNATRDAYTYDMSGNMIEILEQKWESEQWVDSRRHTFTYDIFGNELEWVRQDWDGSQWVYEERSTHTYDAMGNLLELARQSWDGSQGVVYNRDIYSYDDLGRKVEESRIMYHDGQISNGTWYTYIYDANDNVSEAFGKEWIGDQWVNVYHSLVTPISYYATAAFTSDTISGPFPLTVHFYDQSFGTGTMDITSWRWDFGNDGVIDDTLQNPMFTFTTPGDYSVRLIVGDGIALDTLIKEDDIYVSLPENWGVYPGDTDNNGVVEAFDVFPIGIHFKVVGSARDSVSFLWTSFFADAWEIPAATFADANGDGVVDERDVIAIGVNWGNNHEYGSPAFVINSSDSLLLRQHLEAFRTIYSSLSGCTQPVREMKTLLRGILGIKVPEHFTLQQNYPNPFNPRTTIRFSMPEDQKVSMIIFDLLGQEVARPLNNIHFDAGYHEVQLDASQFSSGVYFYRFQAGAWYETKKMMVLK